jgi:formylglycine-generating enzyme required for sulfatase activity
MFVAYIDFKQYCEKISEGYFLRVTLDAVNYRGTWDDRDKWGDGAKKETVDVKTYPCNNWGLFEMHGNVWEWCQDVWQAALGVEPVSDPWKEGEGSEVAAPRVVRGGSWIDYGRVVRSAIRYGGTPGLRCAYLGFRLALGHSRPG